MSDTCDYNRRSFLRIGLSGLLSLAGLPLMNANALQQKSSRIKNCILLYMNGGPSHIDTFDPKPSSRAGGLFRDINTTVGGLRVCEHLPQIAEQAHHLAVIRSMTSREGNHNRARYLMHTGYIPQGSTRHPDLGAMVASSVTDQAFDLPHYITIGFPAYGGGALGSVYDPFFIRNPLRPIENLNPQSPMGPMRKNRRLSLLEWTEQKFTSRFGRIGQEHKTVYDQAIRMMDSSLTSAFNLGEEPQSIRDAYGSGAFGQGCLMARRLIETGVQFVEVSLNGWDTHTDNFTMTQSLMQQLDPAFSRLIIDLSQRDLLDETLIIWMGEFGRTPKINRNEGRDHYPQAWSAVLAGGGVRPGQVIGATDSDGARVVSRPVSLPDFFATVTSLLGMDPEDEYYTSDGRPISYVNGGTPIGEII